MDKDEVTYIATKYGKYLGGIDYASILSHINEEEERLRLVEERLLGYPIREAPREDFGDARRLCEELDALRLEEKRYMEIVNEVKLRGLTKPHVDKAMRRLGTIRSNIRTVRRILKYLGDPLKCL